MASRTVEYIFQLIDKFSANAGSISKAALGAEKNIHAMGEASNALDKKMRGASAAIAAMNAKAIESNPALKGAINVLKGYGEAGETAAKNVRTVAQAHKEITKLQKEAALNAKYAPSGGSNMLGGMVEAYFGAEMIAQAARSVSHFLDTANEQIFAKQKMALVGFKGDMMKEAEKVAGEVKTKYPNISKAEAFEQLYKGVSIYGTAEHSIQNAETQFKLMSFLKAWQGGKHAGMSASAMLEARSAIKSMEMQNVLNEHDEVKKKAEVENYVAALLASKALYGDYSKFSEYQAMQKLAGASFYNFSDQFRFGIVPAMIQERGGMQVGQRLMTAYNTMVGAVQLKKLQQAALAQYGFLEGSGSGAKISAALRDSYLKEPTEAANMIRDRVAKAHGLDLNKPEDVAKLKDILPVVLGRMFPNRNMSGLFTDLIFNDINFKKGLDAWHQIQEEMKKTGVNAARLTKAGAEGSLAASMSNFFSALGGPLMDPYIGRVNNMADMFQRLSEKIESFTKAHQGMSNAAGFATIGGIGIVASTAALATLGAAVQALKWGLQGLNIASLAGLAGRLTGIGLAVTIGYEVVENWSALLGVLEKISGLDLHQLKDLKGGLTALAQTAVTGAAKTVEDLKNIGKEPTDPSRPAFPQPGGGGEFGVPEFVPQTPQSVPQGEAQKEIAVRTTLDPIRVDVTQSVPLSGTIRVEGTVNGPVNGSGTVTGAASGAAQAPRGESAQVDEGSK